MSKDSVLKFFEAIQKDEVLVARLRALEGEFDAFARLSAELGREQGFAFEPSEVQQALAAAAGTPAGELSDQELLAVSGGTGFNNWGWRPTLACRVVGTGGWCGTMTCV